MNDRLDRLLERLAVTPTDRQLDYFEAQVSLGVAGQIAQARTFTALASVRVASMGLALAIGAIAGIATASSSTAALRSSDVVNSTVDLAPSTLLDRRQ